MKFNTQHEEWVNIRIILCIIQSVYISMRHVQLTVYWKQYETIITKRRNSPRRLGRSYFSIFFTTWIRNIIFVPITKELTSFQNFFGVLSGFPRERLKYPFSFQVLPRAA
jgi:hypothetical protein